MDYVSSYVMRLACGALVCGLILAIAGTKGPSGRLRQMLCGIFLAFLALSPLRDMDLGHIQYTDPGIASQAQQIAQAGSDQAKEAMASIIKEQCCAYILNKAAESHLSLTAEVELNPDTGEPESVVLSGDASPYERESLSDYITQTLGIERSAIQWNP